MSDKSLREEKERLMKEVLGKKRPYEKVDVSTSFHSELEKELKAQQKEIEQLDKLQPISNKSLEEFQKQLQEDYELVEQFDHPQESESLFEKITLTIQEHSLVSKDTLQDVSNAFRRPYLLSKDPHGCLNMIYLYGPNGSNRHETIQSFVKQLKNQHVIHSDKITLLDGSSYQTGANEQIFIQDLYQALQDESSVLLFEKFDKIHPPFLRMLETLFTKGVLELPKRYVLNQNILVENQSALVKNAISSITMKDKYVIFLSDQDPKILTKIFTSNFVQEIHDVIHFEAFSKKQLFESFQTQLELLSKNCLKNFDLKVTYQEEFVSKYFESLEIHEGIHSIQKAIQSLYISLSDLVLKDHVKDVELSYQDDGIYANGKHIVEAVQLEKELEKIQQELDEIVGLEQVKEYIQTLQSHLMIQKQREAQGLKSANVSYHMIFTGNPGTGKTMIARLLARYMKLIHVLSSGQLVEVSRMDLVAKYVGQTAPLTLSVMESSFGGVLFIDEAYSLYRGQEDSFGLEAIDTIVKVMEDHRDNLVVILAGYKDEMSEFLESNSGLKSRFSNVLEFPDYTGKQLVEITQLFAKKQGYTIEEQALSHLETYYTYVQNHHAKDAGNARFARNMFEAAVLKQASRLCKDKDENLSLLKDEDFSYEKYMEGEKDL